MALCFNDPCGIALFTTSVVIDSVFRTVTNVRTRVVCRQDIKLKTVINLQNYNMSYTDQMLTSLNSDFEQINDVQLSYVHVSLSA